MKPRIKLTPERVEEIRQIKESLVSKFRLARAGVKIRMGSPKRGLAKFPQQEIKDAAD